MNFIRTGHSLLALIAAILGGLLSRVLHAGNRRRPLGLPSPENGTLNLLSIPWTKP